jgi:hypothetical protein
MLNNSDLKLANLRRIARSWLWRIIMTIGSSVPKLFMWWLVRRTLFPVVTLSVHINSRTPQRQCYFDWRTTILLKIAATPFMFFNSKQSPQRFKPLYLQVWSRCANHYTSQSQPELSIYTTFICFKKLDQVCKKFCLMACPFWLHLLNIKDPMTSSTPKQVFQNFTWFRDGSSHRSVSGWSCNLEKN